MGISAGLFFAVPRALSSQKIAAKKIGSAAMMPVSLASGQRRVASEWRA
jgi:hypothetical protein